MLKGFRDFILRGNVLDLAVAVVVGAAFSDIVKALTKDIITPLIGVFGGQPDFSRVTLTINKSQFLIGDFINAIISFLIIAAIIYFFVILPMNKLMARLNGAKQGEPTTKECPFCISKIAIKAVRCPNCTSELTAAKKR